MTTVYLSLGSNINRQKNISSALKSLIEIFGSIESSPIYESESIGFDGDSFYNLVVRIKCNKSLSELSACLKKIEDDNGRLRSGPRFSSRTLDIDIVIFGNKTGVFGGVELPRPELYYNAFVLRPMADLAASEVDHKSGETYENLWLKNKSELQSRQKLWQIELN
mgnify:CR=1 FL=1